MIAIPALDLRGGAAVRLERRRLRSRAAAHRRPLERRAHLGASGVPPACTSWISMRRLASASNEQVIDDVLADEPHGCPGRRRRAHRGPRRALARARGASGRRRDAGARGHGVAGGSRGTIPARVDRRGGRPRPTDRDARVASHAASGHTRDGGGAQWPAARRCAGDRGAPAGSPARDGPPSRWKTWPKCRVHSSVRGRRDHDRSTTCAPCRTAACRPRSSGWRSTRVRSIPRAAAEEFEE